MPKYPAAIERHFADFPREKEPMSWMSDLFDVTWVERTRIANSTDSYYLLKPKPHATELFGFTKEILCVYSPYEQFEARTLSHAREVGERERLRERVGALYLVVIAPVANLRERLSEYSQDSQQEWIIIPFSEAELIENEDPWLVRKRFEDVLFARDLFDMKQALVDDRYFFGRQNLVLDLRDRFIRGENSGVFGLRKVGKTSALFRLRRVLKAEDAGALVYVDAQSPAVHGLRWYELLFLIKTRAEEAIGAALPHPFDKPFTASTALSRTSQALKSLIEHPKNKGKRLVVVIDEIEHLTPTLSPVEHWNTDFLQFWKLVRAFQTDERRFAFVVAGVNPSVVEASAFEGFDNPLFSLVGIRYMPPLNRQDVRDMVQTLGRGIGMLFDGEACDYLTSRYGGHPLLIRLACSWEHQLRRNDPGVKRPVQVEQMQLTRTVDEREQSLVQYVRHVLGVLKDWYPNEYQMLTLLADGEVETFAQFAADIPEYLQHLRAYGLVSETPPKLAIPVVGDFLRHDAIAARSKATLAGRLGNRDGYGLGYESAQPPLETLLKLREGPHIEFKSTLRRNLRTSKMPDEAIERAALKTIVGFLNAHGGHLVAGVDDDGNVVGMLREDGFGSRDDAMIWLAGKIRTHVGAEHSASIRTRFDTVNGEDVLIIDCAAGTTPAFLELGGTKRFYSRVFSTTQEMAIDEVTPYIAKRFG